MPRTLIAFSALLLLLAASMACTGASGTPTRVIENASPTAAVTASVFEGGNLPTHMPTLGANSTVAFSPTLTRTPAPTATLAPLPTPTLLPGATRLSTKGGMMLIYVPAGDFLMGSAAADPGADPDEFPQHTVYLAAFWIGQTEVTNTMFAAFLNDRGNQVEGSSPWLSASQEGVLILQDPQSRWQSRPGYEIYPVVGVTWYGARAFCEWAGGRLPTEAEWEKAARGADGRIFPWGDALDCAKTTNLDCRSAQLLPVGSSPLGASPFGALEMSGNVWEWVADWYADTYYEISPAENPSGPQAGLARVVRGGSWRFDAKHARTANRRNDGPAVARPDYGFRCAIPGD